MSQRDLHRVMVLKSLLSGHLRLAEAVRALGISERQVRRLRRRFEQSGAEGLLHGNRGRPPSNRIGEPVRRQILELATQRYGQLNDAHLQEQLAQEHGLWVGRETVRRIRRDAGLPAKRRRRARVYRRRRTPAPCRGQMLLWDGSRHAWLGPEQPPVVLMAAIDDADGTLAGARFELQETSIAYLRLLREEPVRF